MKAALERWLLARWYGGREPEWFLLLLSKLYGGLLALHSLLRRGFPGDSGKLPVPVVVVGNFTAGGTGKTPLVIALVEHFRAQGRRPGVVSRGHGRAGNAPIRVCMDTLVDACGDEPLLIHQQTGVPVQVDADRLRAARSLVADGCDLLVADDGLQHRRLARDIEIEVRDGLRGLGNGRLLPAGPLRELPRRVDFRVVNGGGQGRAAGASRDPDEPVGGAPSSWTMQLELTEAVCLADGQVRALSEFRGQRVHAVAGIGHPARFFEALRGCGLDPAGHDFPDHHAYVADDFKGMDGTVLMTAKDAVKCRDLDLRDAWQVPVAAHLPPAFFAALDARLPALAHSRPVFPDPGSAASP